MAYADFDLTEYKDFFSRLREAARGDFKQECEIFLEALGVEFLSLVQDEIIRLEAKENALLLNSFFRNDENSVWELSEDGLLLEVGTNVKYAKYVNDGHWTIDPTKEKHFVLPNGELARFVPGKWDNDRFIYDKDAKTGMVLKQQFVEAKPFFKNAMTIFEKQFPIAMEKKMQQWLDKYFG